MATSNTLDELLRVETSDDLLTFFLTEIANQEEQIPVTDWEEGGVALTILEKVSDALADLSTAQRTIAQGGLLDFAKGPWLTALALSFFRIQRKPAQFAQPKIRLTCAATAGPYTISPGQLRVTTQNARRYTSTNTGNETLLTGGTLDLVFNAEQPGVNYNLSLVTAISLINTLPGVTVSLVETETGSGTPMVQAGSNEETDPQLVVRCRGRWATLGLEKTYQAYEFLSTSIADIAATGEGKAKIDAQNAINAQPGIITVNRSFVDDSNPDGPGTVRIYLGTDDGPVSTVDIVNAIGTFVEGRRGLCATITTQSAAAVTATIKAVIKCEAGSIDNAKTQVDDALKGYQATLSIADGSIADKNQGAVLRSQLVEFFMKPDGVIDDPLDTVLINDLESDLVPTKGQIAKLDWDIFGDTPTIVFEEV